MSMGDNPQPKITQPLFLSGSKLPYWLEFESMCQAFKAVHVGSVVTYCFEGWTQWSNQWGNLVPSRKKVVDLFWDVGCIP